MDKSTRYVTLGNGRQVGLGAYVAAWKAVNAAPDGQEYTHGLTGSWSVTALDVQREYAEGLADRINRHVPGFGVGRKWDSDWQSAARRDAEQINSIGTLRRMVYVTEVITDNWRKRFAHLYARHDD